MPKSESYRNVGRDHPASKPIPRGSKGDSGFTRFGRDVLKQDVPRGGKTPKMGRDFANNPKFPK